MGMATNTNDELEIRRCFRAIKDLANTCSFHCHPDISPKGYQIDTEDNSFTFISMGMSDDHLIAIEEGSNMVRIGSSIFGSRD